MKTISREIWSVLLTEVGFFTDHETSEESARISLGVIAELIPGAEYRHHAASDWHQFRWYGRINDQPQASDVD